MFSTRNRNIEEPYNGPGKPIHHRADGTNHLMLRGDEYHNIWAVFDFSNPHDLVKARKSWFFFDEEYVCLGRVL